MNLVAENTDFPRSLRFLKGDGEMRTRIREFDWGSTDLGHPGEWPHVLKTAVEIMLDCAGAAYIAWGPGYTQLYNDAYISILGANKHPAALGRSTRETWAEIWDFIGPMFDGVMENGQAVSAENHILCLLRNGYLEEAYFSFSYSPLTCDGKAAAVFVTAWETTSEYVASRRANAVRMLVQGLSSATDIQAIRGAFEQTVHAFPEDLPFGLWYEKQEAGGKLSLVAAAGIPRGTSVSPELLDPDDDEFYAGYIKDGMSTVVTREVGNRLPEWVGPDPERAAPRMVGIKPLCYSAAPDFDGYVVLAVNPMRPFDAGQREFFLALRMHLESAVRRVRRQELERREREHQFESVMAVLPCIVWMSDTEQECVFVNETWLRFRGRTRSQELGRGWLQGVHPEDLPRVLHARASRSARVTQSIEFRMLNANGEYRWILSEVTPRYDINAIYLGYIGTGLDITERKRAEQEILSSRMALSKLYDRLQSVREEERVALAREVHDQLGQILSAAKIDIKLLEEDVLSQETLPPRDALSTELRSARQSIDQAINTVRQIASELRAPEIGAQGLYAALAWHAQDFERRTRIRCRLEIAPSLRQPSGSAALALFRVFQEALTNVLRHAKASDVEACVLRRGPAVLLRIRDNGVGIAPACTRSRHSIGIRGMRERATLLKGRLTIGALPGGGTLVSLRIPLKEETGD